MKVIAILVVCLALWIAPVSSAMPSPFVWSGQAGQVLAQESPALTSLTISLWPEYDAPELLVIYRGQFSGDAALPLSVEFRIPVEAGQPGAVAYLDEQGDLLSLEYATRTEGDRLVVAFELPSRDFQLEYYTPLPGSPAPGQRTFAYTYTADYAVTTLDLKVQAPLGSQGFKLEPAADSVVQEADGLNYHLVTTGPLRQNDTVTWSVSYEKTDSGLTVNAFQPAETPTAVVAPAAPVKSKGVSGILVSVLALIALVAVAAGAFWFGKRAQPALAPAAPSKRRRGGQKRNPAQTRMQDAGFCFKCGARLRSDADFCHQCGAAVRKS